MLLLSHWRTFAGAELVIHKGLDYTAMWALFQMLGTENTAEMFDQVKCIEMGALEVLNGQ